MPPMTHRNGSLVVRVPSHRVQCPSALDGPTPMSTNNTTDQSCAATELNDDKWLVDGNPITEKIHEHLLERASPAKSWFKARYISEAVDEPATKVGAVLAAMYRDDDYRAVVDRRSAGGSYVYRVEVDR